MDVTRIITETLTHLSSCVKHKKKNYNKKSECFIKMLGFPNAQSRNALLQEIVIAHSGLNITRCDAQNETCCIYHLLPLLHRWHANKHAYSIF